MNPPKLRYNAESKHWEFGEIDWAEFKQVISGNGPCNRERLAARRAAHDQGAWGREAGAAFAEKQRRRAEMQILARSHAGAKW